MISTAKFFQKLKSTFGFDLYTGNENIAKLLIKAGADINFPNIRKRTPMHVSAQYGTSKVADLLVQAKADLNMRDNDDWTPFMWALITEHHESFENVLRKNRKKINDGIVEDDNEGKLNEK